MKKILLTLLALGVPASASAQWFYDIRPLLDLQTGKFQSIVRPYRDRGERFQSARVSALQMTVAIEDENNRLTFENWADNRADMKRDVSMLKAEAGLTSGESYAGAAKNDDSGRRFGAYARVGAFELEGLSIAQKSETTAGDDEYKKTSAGAGFSFGGEALAFGAHANLNKSEDTDADMETSNNSLGGGLMLRTDLYELGATLDYVSHGVEMKSVNAELPLKGPSLGVHALLKPVKGLTAAVRGSFAKLSGEADWAGTKFDYEADQKELGARLEWKFDAIPVTLGLEYSRFLYAPGGTVGALTQDTEYDHDLKTAGAALNLFGGRLMLGAEAQLLTTHMENIQNGALDDEDDQDYRTITGGAELWLLPGFAVRASYQKLVEEGQAGSDDILNNTMAAGVGFKGESLSLDAALRRVTQDEDAVNPNKYNDARVMLTLKF